MTTDRVATDEIQQGLHQTLANSSSGCLDPEAALIDGRRDTGQFAPVVPIGALARYDRPAPSSDYDQLLTGSGT